MADKSVDIAELEKQYAELGTMIKDLGGNVDPVAKAKADKTTDDLEPSDDAKLKAKKAADKEALAKAKGKGKGGSAPKGDKEYDDVEDEGDGGDDEDMEKGAADETVVFKGQTIKKSVVGPVQFGLAKSMVEEIEKTSKAVIKAQDDALLAKLEKRADDEFAHVPGTSAERAAMLKAVSEMPEPLRKSFEAVFKQSEALAKNAFEMKGTNAGDSDDVKKGVADFKAKVKEIAKRDSCGSAAAMSKARVEHPDLFKIYQESQN